MTATVDGDVHSLIQNSVIHGNVFQVFGRPAEQEGVDEIQTYLKKQRDQTEVKIEKNDAPAFETFSSGVLPPLEPIKEIESQPTTYFLKPKRLSAEGEPDNWSFRVGADDILHVDKISDKGFLGRVKNGQYRLSHDDLITAEIVVRQKVSGRNIISKMTELVRVIEYKPAPLYQQGQLFPPEKKE